MTDHKVTLEEIGQLTLRAEKAQDDFIKAANRIVLMFSRRLDVKEELSKQLRELEKKKDELLNSEEADESVLDQLAEKKEDIQRRLGEEEKIITKGRILVGLVVKQRRSGLRLRQAVDNIWRMVDQTPIAF